MNNSKYRRFEVVEKDCQARQLCKADATNRSKLPGVENVVTGVSD